MTQQLTIEQLEFARSIGATRYLKDGMWESPGSSYFFFRDCFEWVQGDWAPCSHSVSDNTKYPPIDFSPLDELDPEYVPEVGDWCLSSGGAEMFYIGKNSDDDGVFQLEDGGLTCFDSLDGFRPLPDPDQQRREELLSKWRGQSLDYAHDTEQSQVSLARVFDFIVDMVGE